MNELPTLRTDAPLQHPVTRTRRYSTRVLCFVDGTEQRYREYAKPLHRWTLRYEGLDEAEMGRLGAFFETQRGGLGSFTFHDPISGTPAGDCRLAADVIDLRFTEEGRGRVEIEVEENKS